MKGVYQSPDNYFLQSVQEKLLRNTSYRFDSGGKPSDIPKLSYDQFI
jgi:Zn-dependent M16 (insulinase) family peptidase